MSRFKYTLDTKEKPVGQTLTFVRLPIAAWSLSLFVGGCWGYVIWKISNEKYHKNQVTWWHVMLVIFLISMSVIFLVTGKIEVARINKQTGLVSHTKISVFCRQKRKVGTLDDLLSVTCYRKGHAGVMLHNLHYSVRCEFRSRAAVELFRSRSKTKITRQTAQIKTFIG